jgi:HSP20 family molecular chaperone IbpA
MNYLTTRGDDFPSLFTDVFFKDFFGDDLFSPLPSLKKINYPVNIIEKNKELIFEIAAIGLDKSDIKIDVKDDIISVIYQKESIDKEEKCAYRGITQKSFNFAWKVNKRFDLSKTKASLEKGMLKIIIPLKPEKECKEISVTIE